MNIIYLTSLTPYGKGESFVLNEIDALQAMGHRIDDHSHSPGNGTWRFRRDTQSFAARLTD